MLIDTKWVDGKGKTFIVKLVEEREDGTWVVYNCINDNNTFECLLESFQERFFRINNG